MRGGPGLAGGQEAAERPGIVEKSSVVRVVSASMGSPFFAACSMILSSTSVMFRHIGTSE
jgi:hypothetical protein